MTREEAYQYVKEKFPNINDILEINDLATAYMDGAIDQTRAIREELEHEGLLQREEK